MDSLLVYDQLLYNGSNEYRAALVGDKLTIYKTDTIASLTAFSDVYYIIWQDIYTLIIVKRGQYAYSVHPYDAQEGCFKEGVLDICSALLFLAREGKPAKSVLENVRF